MSARDFLAKEIRRAREAKGMSRTAVGKALFVSGELVAAWESGRSLPQPNHVIDLIGILEFGPDIVVRILEDLVSGEVSPQWTGKWLAIEKRADTVLSFELSVVPGLLQTEGYARAVLRHNHHSPLDPEQQVKERLRRQKEVLGRETPPMSVFIMDESILWRKIRVEPKIMAEQLTHLVEVSKQPDTIVQVVPSEVGDHAGLVGPFMIAKVDGRELAYQDGALRGEVIEECSEVHALSRVWQNIHSAALSDSASIERIEKAAARWMQ